MATVTISKSVGNGGNAKRGVKDADVLKVQRLLNKAGARPRLVEDGFIGAKTIKAITQYQASFMKSPDGRVDPGGGTLRRLNAAAGGIAPGGDTPKDSQPPRPSFNPLGYEGRIRLFGEFEYEHPNQNKDEIVIKGNWQRDNINKVYIPQLKGVPMWGALKCSGYVRWNRKCVEQLRMLWGDWEQAGLLDRVVNFGGSFNPRFIRGSARTSSRQLSNHSWGTAFDINTRQNGLGKTPAKIGQAGCVKELVALAIHHGFYWGGHFSRKDGMHFEIARVGSEINEVSYGGNTVYA